MKNIFVVLFITIGCMQQAAAQDATPLKITLVKNSAREQQTKEQLLALLKQYNLSKWIFTDSIIIEDGFHVIPHSHPVLTLNTRHIKDNELLLSTFIHEQLHWFLQSKPAESKEAFLALKKLFPNAPVAFPDGSGDEESTYYHILVCYLEYQALKQLMGELRSKQIISFWMTDHYKWIYQTVLEQERSIGSIVQKSKLSPGK